MCVTATFAEALWRNSSSRHWLRPRGWKADYDRFDRIIPEDPEGKIHLMMSYTGVGRDVADPWYTGDFEETFQDLLEGCEAMLTTCP